jgi:hypothetical protein
MFSIEKPRDFFGACSRIPFHLGGDRLGRRWAWLSSGFRPEGLSPLETMSFQRPAAKYLVPRRESCAGGAGSRRNIAFFVPRY